MIRKMINRFFYLWNNQFIRFLFIGGLNTLFGYSVFAILIFFNIHYSLALFAATILGVFFNFKTLGVLVYKDAKNSKIFRFIAVYALLYFFNLAIVAALKRMDMNTYAAGAVAILPVAVTGFFLNKIFVFD